MTPAPERLRIAICTAQVPFVRGGAEVLVETLADELRRRGHEVDVVALPFSWDTRERLVRTAALWRLVDLYDVETGSADLVIATRFPSYLVRHPRKVVWLVHQFRQIYELQGTPYSDFGREDAATVAVLREMDRRALSEARAVFGISANTSRRLREFNGLESEVLYPPPKAADRYRSNDYGDFVLTASRLDPMKRVDGLLEAMARTDSDVCCKIAGSGPERERLEALARELGVEERVEFLGFVPDEELIELFSRALAVYYAPYDEDYGYVTVEACLSGRPVVTARDSGGVLEFVEDGMNGFVVEPGDAAALGAHLDRLYRDRELAARLGRASGRRVAEISWDRVVRGLVGRPDGDAM